MTEVKQNQEEDPQPSVPRSIAQWSWIVPVVWFVSGAGGFFYEVIAGQNFQLAALCAVWAAGGPALIADRLVRSLR